MLRRALVLLSCAVAGAAVLAACGGGSAPSDRLSPPKSDTCRELDAADLAESTNDDPVVPCSKPHTARTFLTGVLPKRTGKARDAEGHGRFVYRTCGTAFREYLGADESLALRVQLSWAWFRPSQEAWDKGARWFRCDIVGGPEAAKKFSPLPRKLEGIFARGLPADRWMTCSRGTTLATGSKVPCSQKHDWRAVSTIKVGLPDEEYPGDKVIRSRSRDRCSDWVGAWLHYAPDYDFAYTWYHQAEWEAGNRRTVCWARTEQ